MSITTHERFVSYPARFNGGGFALNHVRRVSLSPGVEKMVIIPGGSVDPAVIAEAFREPVFTIVSGDLGAVLDGVSPVAGLACTSASLIQWQQRLDGGVFAGSGNHATFSIPKGFLYPTEITAQQDAREGAEISLLFYALRSGANMPVVANTGQSLTGSVAVNGLYRLSKVVFEGSVVGGVQSVRVTTGITYQPKRESWNVAADVGSIVRREPMIEVRGTNLAKVAAVGLGLAAVSAGLTVYFEKIGATNGNHLSFGIAGGAYHTDGFDQQGLDDAEGRIVASLANGTLGFDTTATIP